MLSATLPRAGRSADLLLATLRPTARVSHLGRTGTTVTLGTLPAVYAALRGGTIASLPLVIACLVAGAALGWATDDPAAELLASMPVSTATRSALRVAFATVTAAAAIGLMLLAVVVGPGVPSHQADRLPEAAAAAAIALAFGLVGARRGEQLAGPAGVTAGIVGTAFVAALAFRWPTLLPALETGPTHTRWWLIAAAAAILALHAGRDPGRR
jgi:hypothetical protein